MQTTKVKHLMMIKNINKEPAKNHVKVELPQEKQVNIKKKINKFKLFKECKIKEFASLVGNLGSCCITLKYGKVYLQDIE